MIEAAGDQPSMTTPNVRIRKDKTNPRRFFYLALLLFAPTPSWPLLALGAVLVVLAILLHGWAAGYLNRAGYASRTEKLLTARGPYRHNRNPYYLAHLSMDLGFFCMAGLPWLYLAYFPIAFAVYRKRVMSEEQFLNAEFGDDFRVFANDVPRWGFRLTPARARGHDQKFEWTLLARNQEWARAGSHALLLLVFVGYFLFGNPLDAVDVEARAALLAAVAGWLLVHDVYRQDDIHTGGIWTLVALVMIAGIGALFMIGDLWDPWPAHWSWLTLPLAAALAVAAVLIRQPSYYRRLDKVGTLAAPHHAMRWYAAGLAVGLCSGTTGGLWLGILVPLTMWAMGTSGWSSYRLFPRTAIATPVLAILIVLITGTNPLIGRGPAADLGFAWISNRTSLIGTAQDESLIGGDERNFLDGGFGNDLLSGGGGDDILIYDPDDLLTLDGGIGERDILRLRNGYHLDLTQMPDDRLTGIEIFDGEHDPYPNAFTMRLDDVVALGLKTLPLLIKGNTGDSVDMGPEFQPDGDQRHEHRRYRRYIAAATGTVILIDRDISIISQTLAVRS